MNCFRLYIHYFAPITPPPPPKKIAINIKSICMRTMQGFRATVHVVNRENVSFDLCIRIMC